MGQQAQGLVEPLQKSTILGFLLTDLLRAFSRTPLHSLVSMFRRQEYRVDLPFQSSTTSLGLLMQVVTEGPPEFESAVCSVQYTANAICPRHALSGRSWTLKTIEALHRDGVVGGRGRAVLQSIQSLDLCCVRRILQSKCPLEAALRGPLKL